jgi:hypothetical protein
MTLRAPGISILLFAALALLAASPALGCVRLVSHNNLARRSGRVRGV